MALALLVTRIGAGNSPIGHGASRIDNGGLTEGTLGLQVPKAVELTDPLVKESLALGILGSHGEVHLGHAFHDVGPLADLRRTRPHERNAGGQGGVLFSLFGEGVASKANSTAIGREGKTKTNFA